MVYTNLDFFNEDVDGDNYLGVRADSGNNRLPFDSLSPISVTSLDTQNVQDIITQAIVVEPVLRMRDFRRYRDWLLAAEGVASFNQGSANHPKVQTDVGSLANALGDANGDGQLRLNERIVVNDMERRSAGFTVMQGFNLSAGGATSITLPRSPDDHPYLSDFEVFYYTLQRNDTWRDEHYALSELPNLVYSGDVEVWPWRCGHLETLYPSAPTRSEVDGKTFTHLDIINRETTSGRFIYTLPTGTHQIKLFVTVFNKDGNSVEKEIKKNISVQPGSDRLWDPDCRDIEVTPEELADSFDMPLSEDETIRTHTIALENVGPGDVQWRAQMPYNTHIRMVGQYRPLYSDTVYLPRQQATLHVNETRDIEVEFICRKVIALETVITIYTNDTDNPEIEIPVSLNCTLPPAPMPIWTDEPGVPENSAEMLKWSGCACNHAMYAAAKGIHRGLSSGNQDLGWVVGGGLRPRRLYNQYSFIYWIDKEDEFVTLEENEVIDGYVRQYEPVAEGMWAAFIDPCEDGTSPYRE